MTNVGEDDEPSIVQPVYVYTGPKFLADLKLRIGEWLDERRGW
ncbi:hypothetical protein [Halorussus caseinilyticus]|uniref:Uncharacterized protein n=1 Tax=Halorussus caseinilyticus TaxID=3034025 RepID=A0ABD5WJN9_9EURY|nr:hypothetical protein [Halorussus sp. DT72]